MYPTVNQQLDNKHYILQQTYKYLNLSLSRFSSLSLSSISRQPPGLYKLRHQTTHQDIKKIHVHHDNSTSTLIILPSIMFSSEVIATGSSFLFFSGSFLLQ